MSGAEGSSPGESDLGDEFLELSDDDTYSAEPTDFLVEDVNPEPRFAFPWMSRLGYRVSWPQPYEKEAHDATTRRRLAYWVLTIVSVLYFMAVLGMICHWINVEELGRIALVLGPIQALAAAVLGFYFGRDNKS